MSLPTHDAVSIARQLSVWSLALEIAIEDMSDSAVLLAADQVDAIHDVAHHIRRLARMLDVKSQPATTIGGRQ